VALGLTGGRLAGSQRNVRLVRREVACDLPAEQVLGQLRPDRSPFALIGAWAGGGAILGSEPVRWRSPPQPLADVADAPFPAEYLDPRDGGFGGGWVGYLGYGLGGQWPTLPPAPGPPRRLSPWWFGYYDHVLRQEAASGRWYFEALVSPQRATAVEHRYAELAARLRRPRPPRPYTCGEFTVTPSPGAHVASVARAVELIRQGDMFQANICLHLEADFRGDPLDLFGQGVRRLQPPFAAFVQTHQGAIASFSPELFLRRQGRTVVTSPIKGTCARPAEPEAAAAQRTALERSAKNVAENVMIVDLMRNDLSRVCEPGTVQVPTLARAQPHPGVWHLVSDVHGRLAADVTDGDLIRAAFPPGSVTGAPKVRAMEVIHELEAMPREAYTGAIGYRSPGAGLELNVAIRTFEFHRDRVWLGAGGGIVADSDPADEFRECLLKARPLVEAVGGTFAASGTPRASSGSGVLAPRTGGPDARAVPRAGPADHRPRRPGRPVVLLIDNYDSFTYNLAHLLLTCGADVEVVRNDEVSAAQAVGFGAAGVLISPGPCTPAEAGISVDVVRGLAGQTPLLGVCLGHQAIAVAYGGAIERVEPRHGKTSVIEHDGRGLFHGLPARFPATRYHSLQVDESTLPAELSVTARTPDGLPMAIRHIKDPVDGVQFHPESILTSHGATLMINFARSVGGAGGSSPREESRAPASWPQGQ
jgi:aminodeoxychorismate synthase component I